VKICVLALLIERIAERACDMPWHRICRGLEALQVTKFFNLNHRVTMRNEISNETRNILKKLDIKPPPQVVHLENHSPK
jgi:alpha-D-ribose 1-methylphosphonate 5-triphosphate diphosphatase PhnM